MSLHAATHVLCLFLACGLGAAGVFASVRDARTRTIPNACCGAICLLGLALCCLRALTGALPALPAPVSCATVAVATLLLGVAAEGAYRAVSGRVGLGLGDVKYMAAWACALGWWVAPALAAACLGGALYACTRRERTFAMAPWLTLAFACAFVVALLR